MKSERIRASLIDQSAIRRVLPDGLIDCLSEELAAAAGVKTTEAVSSNDYDPWILEYIDSHPDAASSS